MFVDGLQMRNVLSGGKLIDREWERQQKKEYLERNRRPDRSLNQLSS